MSLFTFARDSCVGPVTINCTDRDIAAFQVIKSRVTEISDRASWGQAAVPHMASVGQQRRVPA